MRSVRLQSHAAECCSKARDITAYISYAKNMFVRNIQNSDLLLLLPV